MELEHTQLTRRNFVEALAAAGALGAFSNWAIARPQMASADEGQLADTIIFAQGADPRGLDPAFVDDGESAAVTNNIYESLICYAPETTDLEPGLASSWDVSDDGLTYTFHLYEGIKFHDGTDCNADAVKRSIERQLEPNRTDDMPYASFVFGSEESGTGVESVEATDDLTLVIKLRAVNAAFLKNIAMCMAAPIVSPTAFEAAENQNINEAPCGTGPYKFVEWNKGQNITLTRNDDYWNPDKAAKTQTIIYRFIAENSSRVTSLINNEVDIINGIDDSVIPTITDAGYSLFSADGMTINYMAFNTQSELFSNVDNRKAICKAINREELVEALYGEYATPANSVMPLFMAPYDEDIEQIGYDPDAARDELAAAGITSVHMVTYSNVRPYNTKNGQTLAEAIQGYLAEVGVDAQIDVYDWTTYKSIVQNDEFDICFYGWQGDNGDPDNFMNLLADANWSMNVARYDNADYKALIAAGQAELDEDARNEIYHQCEQHVAENVPWYVISHAMNLCGYNPKVQNFYWHPTGTVFFWNVTKQA